MDDKTRKDGQQQPAAIAPDHSKPAATQHDADGAGDAGSYFYDQALSMCNRALKAGAFKDALLWAGQAEQIGAVLQERQGMPEVTKAYATVMLSACLRSQELALTTGNILKEHRELADVLATATARIAVRLGADDQKEPQVVALAAQGFVTQHNARMSDFFKTEEYRYTPPQDLDAMLEALASIEQCAEKLLASPDAGAQPLSRKLVIAETAVSNARYSLSRLFSSWLSDWVKAEFYCRRAYLLLTTRQITEGALAPSGDANLDRALSTFPAAYAALQRRDYKESTERLKAVSEGLKRVSKS